MIEWYSQEKARSHDCYLAFGCWAGWSNTCVRPRVESTAMFKKQRRINEFLLPGVLPLVLGLVVRLWPEWQIGMARCRAGRI